MNHNLFKPANIDDGKHAVVGNCNGISAEERWETETPLFAKAILSNLHGNTILDYGCGIGRITKELITQNNSVEITGVDASQDMLQLATDYISDNRFTAMFPQDIPKDIKFDLIYCIYVLQHVPAIEIREILNRIYDHLSDNGVFIYCSSDYRMAIRFDGQGFFDDRFLGVNLQEEVERKFDKISELFTDIDYEHNPTLRTMVLGEGNNLPHPAFVFKKKPNDSIPKPVKIIRQKQPQKLILVARQSPGDVLVMGNAIACLQKSYQNKYQIEVRTSSTDIFKNNPFITKHIYDECKYKEIENKFSLTPHSDMTKDSRTSWLDDIMVIDMHYPAIHQSGQSGKHFTSAYIEWLEYILDLKINQSFMRPEIYLDQNEMNWYSPIVSEHKYRGRYWILNAGGKNDFTLKQYSHYQEVVNRLKSFDIKCVQIGQLEHEHKPLENVLSMIGKTDIRQLFRLIYKSDGVITPVSFPMHIAGALEYPCVVVAGAREGARWESYPNHQFLSVNGCLPCAKYDGCWKSKTAECDNKINNIPKCLSLIDPEDIVRSVLRYYKGGYLKPL